MPLELPQHAGQEVLPRDGAAADEKLAAHIPAKLVECLRASLAEKGGTLETRTVAGATAYLAARGDSPDKVWLAFGGPDTLILAGEEAWLAKARDPGAPKVKGSPETMALIGKTDTTRGLWGVGTLPPELAGALAGATQGAVTGPVSALYGSVDVDKGLSAEANLVMATDADARGLVEFGGKQLQSLTVMAQSVGLAPVVAKIKLHADGRIARTTIHLDAAELEALEAQLDGSALQPKEGVPQ